MSTLLEQLEKVQPCDNRNLLQILSLAVTQEVLELKEKACTKLSDIFASYGIEDFKPCEDLTEEFLEQILAKDPLEAMNGLLFSIGFPPKLIDILINGVDNLSLEDEQRLYTWALGSQGIKVHPETAVYVRTKTNRPTSPYPPMNLEQQKRVENWYVAQGVQEVTQVVFSMIQEFIIKKIKCPPQPVLVKSINIVNNLIKITNKAQTTFSRLQTAVNIASATISTLNAAIQAAKTTTAANDVAIVGLTASGVGVVGVGPLVQASRLLDKVIIRIEPQVKELDKSLCAVAKTVQFITLQITIIYALLQVIDALLRSCLEKLGEDIGTRLEQLNTFNLDLNFNTTYRGYTIEVRTANSSIPSAPLRYAVALDSQNIVVLEGTRSFSASTDVLVDEIRFRIDNLLG